MTGRRSGRCALLVEDNEATLDVMTKLLERLGHRVTAAPTMVGGLAAARGDTFDLLLSDLGLPDGSGLELMRELRDQFAGRAIALTGYGMEEDVRRCREAGFAVHLTKPIPDEAHRPPDAGGRPP
jgi:CheY-like chemotaxis protein